MNKVRAKIRTGLCLLILSFLVITLGVIVVDLANVGSNHNLEKSLKVIGIIFVLMSGVIDKNAWTHSFWQYLRGSSSSTLFSSFLFWLGALCLVSLFFI